MTERISLTIKGLHKTAHDGNNYIRTDDAENHSSRSDQDLAR